MASFFENTPLEPPNAILGVAQECNQDPFPGKINLTIGAYRDETGKSVVLRSVRAAEEHLFHAKTDHEYLVQDGHLHFNQLAQELMFGRQIPSVFTIQAVAGTGAIRLGADFLRRILPDAVIAIPEVTWQNHPAIFGAIGFKIAHYRYLAADGCNLDFNGMLEDIRNLPPHSIVLLHSCAHNPSGCDPSEDQWRQLLQVVEENNLLPFFDNAYQGFVSGDPEADAFAVRLFAEKGIELLAACSFSKNFGLYGERVGALHVLCRNEDEKIRTGSVLRATARLLYSTCPSFGSRIVATILGDPERKRQWLEDCHAMATRLLTVRETLFNALVEKNVKGVWGHVVQQRGMFSYSGIPGWAVKKLKEDHHIYLLNDGRISLAGLNQSNIGRVVDALVTVLGTN